MSSQTPVGAVIVAAGISSRMGDYKPLMEIGGVTMARRVLCALAEAEAHPIVVVTGYRADELEAHLTGILPHTPEFVRNDRYRATTMHESAQLGLTRVMNRCERTFFTPIDVPLFTPDTARRLTRSDAQIVKPVYNGKEGHPILIANHLIPALVPAPGSAGAKGGLSAALAAFESVTERIDVGDEGILHDADTPEDMKLLRSICDEASRDRT
jgi:CTP:molybdopterin cytidylyltransferase MocA